MTTIEPVAVQMAVPKITDNCNDGGIVSKFGGSSVLEFDLVSRIVQDDPNRRWIVLSAPGDADKNFRVTQLLVRLAYLTHPLSSSAAKKSDLCLDSAGAYNGLAVRDIQEHIIAKYSTIFGSKANCIVRSSLDERLAATTLSFPAYLANLKAFGEDMAARLAAQALNLNYVSLQDLLVVDGPFDRARTLECSYQAIKERLSGGRHVIPGFFGYGTDGLIRTFAYGGSDRTGAEIARAVGASCYENFTESPIMAADPKYVQSPEIIAEMTLTELRDLSYAGFGIYHSEAISPLLPQGISLHVRSTRCYPEEGTWIRSDRVSNINHPVVGVAYREGLCGFSISKTGLNDLLGILSTTAGVLRDENVSIEFPAVGIDDISYVASQEQIDGDKLQRIRRAILALTGGGEFTFYSNLGCAAIAGEGIHRQALQVSSRANDALSKAGMSVYASSMGIERRCILYAIPMEQGHLTIEALYKEFIGK